MTVAVTSALLGVIALAVVIAMIRFRRLKREAAAARRRHAASLSSLAPAPYESSRGVRLLEPGEVPLQRAEPSRARLEHVTQTVFTDSGEADTAAARRRHDERWLLERSTRRSRMSSASLRVLIIGILVIAALIGAGAYLQAHSSTSTTTTTTTTTTTVPPSGA